MAFPNTRVRRVVSWVVVLAGWATLLATTAVHHYWSIASGTLDLDFDVPPSTETYETYAIHVEGHPSLARANLVLWIEEPGVVITEGDAGVPDLPVVQGSFSPVTPTRNGDSGHAPEWRYVLANECTRIPCDVNVRIGVRSGPAPYVRHFQLTAAVEGFDADDPPPGEMTFTRVGGP